MATTTSEKLLEQALEFFRKERLPASWKWVEQLSPVNRRLFPVQLADAVKTATITGRTTELEYLLDDWKATAELDASPRLQAELRRKKKYVTLEPFSR